MSASPFARRFGDDPAAWCLFRDDHVLVLDKPAGVACHPVDATEVAHVAAWIEPWLGRKPALLHALDREASGVLVLALEKSASQELGRQLEGGVRTSHLVGVGARPRGIAHEVVARRGDRLVLRVVDVRHVRRALAEAGAPIAGDRDRGGPPAPRLLWHQEELRLRHPATDAPLPARAAMPGAFQRWLDGDAGLDHLEARLAEAAARRHPLARRDDTDAYRLAHGAGDELPGLTVDVLGAHAIVSLASDEALALRDRIFDAVHALGFSGVYAKLRPRKASTLVDTRREEVAPAEPVRGAPAPSPQVVRELGVAYVVRLGDGLSTGIFLDQRGNRAWLRMASAGRSVLNLFAYHGAFTVAAIAGGARRTVTVDASGVALERAAENLALHGAGDDPAHRLVKADAAEWLASCRERFDLVVLDPPSFSTTKHSTFRAAHDLRRLAALALTCVAPGGTLFASTNLRRMSPAELERTLRQAAGDARRAIAKVRAMPPPLDHPPAPGEPWHLKCARVELAD